MSKHMGHIFPNCFPQGAEGAQKQHLDCYIIKIKKHVQKYVIEYIFLKCFPQCDKGAQKQHLDYYILRTQKTRKLP